MAAIPVMPTRILIVGGGGREHALAWKLAAEPGVNEVVVAPGSDAIAREPRVLRAAGVDPLDPEAVLAIARQRSVELAVIGPEAPLAAGVADAVRDAGVACFGPSQQAAVLESSKAFAKDVMAAAGVPTAGHRVCEDPVAVEAALDAFGPPYVVKNDGLAAGKGVVVTDDRALAREHAAACGRVVIEEYLDGPEVSLFVVTDGEAALPLVPAQDFKRIGDGDTGLNTGGMGAYAPLPWAPPDLVEAVMSTVAGPTLAEMRRRDRASCLHEKP